MEMKVQVPFQQLLSAVKGLTPAQKVRLQAELNAEKERKNSKEEFIDFLLNGPVYTDKDLRVIENNRKSIAKWRSKN